MQPIDVPWVKLWSAYCTYKEQSWILPDGGRGGKDYADLTPFGVVEGIQALLLSLLF
jgi:hypothetical protein